MQIGAFTTTSQAIKAIYVEQGIKRGFYAGFGSFVLRDIPFSAIQFPLYELLKMKSIKYYAKQRNERAEDVKIPMFVNSINGSLAGSTAGFLTTPFDVIKTRKMTFQTSSTSIFGLIQQILN